MDNSTTRPRPPNRSGDIPESYAVYVNSQRINAWQYRVDISDPDGKWHFVETLDREGDPRLTIDHATLMPPATDGYWIYSRSYDCELECE